MNDLNLGMLVGAVLMAGGIVFGRAFAGLMRKKPVADKPCLDTTAWDMAHKNYWQVVIDHAREDLAAKRIGQDKCVICGKTDFGANLADIEWMDTDKYYRTTYAHPECAGIVRSDDGKGWVRKAKAKK